MATRNNLVVKWVATGISLMGLFVLVWFALDGKARSAVNIAQEAKKEAAVNAARIQALAENVREIRTDVKELLRRIP